MAKEATKPHNEILEELYELDPDLRAHAAVLPRLIEALSERRPTVAINPTFVADLRASLLTYKPVVAANSTPTLSPFFWWCTRLAPVGVALALFVALLPEKTVAPTEPLMPFVPPQAKEAGDVPPTTGDEGTMMRTELFSTEPATDAVSTESMMTMDAMDVSTTPLLVAPPLASTSDLTITSLTLAEPGWVVVYEDAGGALGATLHTSLLTAGTYTDLTLPLGRSLTYPELVTVVVYTAADSTGFSVAEEVIQIDPTSGVPLSTTVPVVSELELNLEP